MMNNSPTQADNPLLSTEKPTAETYLYPIEHLGVISIQGDDAAQFLQGQCTCDIRSINEGSSSFGAFCNAKGRVISTFVITKQSDALLLILPLALLPQILQRLQRYILRSKVALLDCSATHKLTGLLTNAADPNDLEVPGSHTLFIPYPTCNPVRYVIISDTASTQLNSNSAYTVKSCLDWQFLDIQAGIAWLNMSNTEEYIPQMLNLDKLGGISFNKGCYTGQEIVARTHYLGKSKRNLYVAKVMQDFDFNPSCIITEPNNEQKVGNIINCVPRSDGCYLLIVLNIDVVELPKLFISNANQHPAELILCTEVDQETPAEFSL